jgi:hypothetical protein
VNRNQTLFVIGAISWAIVAWQIWDRESTLPDSTRQPIVSTTAPSEAGEPPLVGYGVDGQDLAAPEVAGADSEFEVGLTAREDRDCSVELYQRIDAQSDDHSCESSYPPEPDPYESWDEETLAGMAYGDAHAAEVLGLRHVASTDPRREALGLALLYRSVALSGDSDSFQKAIGLRYAYLEIDGEPQVHNLRQLLVFSVIGKILGDQRLNSTQLSRYLKQADVPQTEIEGIRAGARSILQGMADLQTEMTGDTTITEALENA